MSEQNQFSVFGEGAREQISETSIERPTFKELYNIFEEVAETDLQKSAVEAAKSEMLVNERSMKWWKQATAGQVELPQGQKPMGAEQVYSQNAFELIRPRGYDPKFINSLPTMTRNQVLPEHMRNWIDQEMSAFDPFLERILIKMGALKEGQSLVDLKSLPAGEGKYSVSDGEKEPCYNERYQAAYDLPTNIEGLRVDVYIDQQRIRGVLNQEINQKEIENLSFE